MYSPFPCYFKTNEADKRFGVDIRCMGCTEESTLQLLSDFMGLSRLMAHHGILTTSMNAMTGLQVRGFVGICSTIAAFQPCGNTLINLLLQPPALSAH